MEIAVAKPFIILSAYLMTAATVSPPTACCKEREREETWKKGSVKLIKLFEDNEDTRSMTQMQVHTYCIALHLAARTYTHTHARTTTTYLQQDNNNNNGAVSLKEPCLPHCSPVLDKHGRQSKHKAEKTYRGNRYKAFCNGLHNANRVQLESIIMKVVNIDLLYVDYFLDKINAQHTETKVIMCTVSHTDPTIANTQKLCRIPPPPPHAVSHTDTTLRSIVGWGDMSQVCMYVLKSQGPLW